MGKWKVGTGVGTGIASHPGVQKGGGTPGTHCLRMRLICYWAIALWTLVTSMYGLGFVITSRELLDNKIVTKILGCGNDGVC